MRGLKIHTFKGEKNRDDSEIKGSNSFVYSELNSFEVELYSGHYGVKMPLNGLRNSVFNQPLQFYYGYPG